MTDPFTVVLPVRDEEKLLPVTFPAVYDLNPDEILVVLDHCTDRSEDIIRKIHDEKGDDVTLRLMDGYVDPSYKWNIPYLRRRAYLKARNDLILNSSADIILDPGIPGTMNLIDDKVKLLKYGLWDYPYTVQCFLRRLYSAFTPLESNRGLYSFDRKAWLETEDPESVKVLERSEDTHLILSMEKKYRTKYINTNTFTLRPNEQFSRNIERGENYAKLVGIGYLKALGMSFLMLRPHFFVGYVKQRRRMK